MIFRVLSASGCAFKAAAWVDVLRVLGKTGLDNTDVARDHSFHCIAGAESFGAARHTTHVGLMVSISSTPFPKLVTFLQHPRHELRKQGVPVFSAAVQFPIFQLPSGFRKVVEDRLIFKPVRNTQAGARASASLPA